MLSVVVFLPVLAAIVLVAVPRITDAAARWIWLVVTLVDFALVVGLWLAYRDPGAGNLAWFWATRLPPGAEWAAPPCPGVFNARIH